MKKETLWEIFGCLGTEVGEVKANTNLMSLMDFDGGSQHFLPSDPLVGSGLGIHLLTQITSFFDNSLYLSGSIHDILALREAFSCFSKFAGGFIFWLSTGGSNARLGRKLKGGNVGAADSRYSSHLQYSVGHNAPGFKNSIKLGGLSPHTFRKILGSVFRNLVGDSNQLQTLPMLSLAAALVPPFENITSIVMPLENAHVQIHGYMESPLGDGQRQGCGGLCFSDVYRKRYAVETKTGIEFPVVLDNVSSGANSSPFISEVLVGTGSKTMKIIKIKSLKVYAYGFYVCPHALREKLGAKYASAAASELRKHNEFYRDLLREDIDMTLRLVVNCNGMKISTVKVAFEKSLRDRLLKTNPNTDFSCLSTFGSYFQQDIPIPTGTVINFHRTGDGRLTTEIEGKQIGAVQSRDLCHAFFGMYIGDSPVSEQSKEEIGTNVANIITRC